MDPPPVPGWIPVDFLIVRHGQTTWNAGGMIQGQADAPLDDVGWAQAKALAEELSVPIDRKQTQLPTPRLPIVTSDLSRAADTARVLAEAISRAQTVDGTTGATAEAPEDATHSVSNIIETTPNLRERHVGRLQGLLRSEAREKDPTAWRAFRSKDDSMKIPNGGESFDDLWDRTVGFVEATAVKRAMEISKESNKCMKVAIDDDANTTTLYPVQNNKNEATALVTHGGVARVFLDRCARDNDEVIRVTGGSNDERKKTQNTETKSDSDYEKSYHLPGVNRPGVVPNCSVGLIRVFVPCDSNSNVNVKEDLVWETVVWGETKFLRNPNSDESAAGEDYA